MEHNFSPYNFHEYPRMTITQQHLFLVPVLTGPEKKRYQEDLKNNLSYWNAYY